MIRPSGKHEGQTSTKGVMWFQDWTFMINDRPDRRRTDEELLTEWRQEFPQAEGKVFVESFDEGLTILRAVRAHYNVGRQGHGKRDDKGELGGGADTISLPYGDDRRVHWYSERWLNGILAARPDLRDPR